MIWLWSRRGRITLGVVGLALAVAPIVGVQLLIDHSTSTHARQTVAELAEDFVANSERALDRALDAVNTLALGGVSGCRPGDIALMRRIATSILAIKVAAMVDGDGNPICDQFGATDSVVLLSPTQPLKEDRTSLRYVRLQSTGRTAVMVARDLGDGQRLAVFIAGDAFARGTLPRSLRASATGALKLANGVTIGTVRPANPDAGSAAGGKPIVAEAISSRLPITMQLTVPYDSFTAEGAELLFYVRLGGGLASTLIFCLLVYLLRGPPVEIARLREAAARGEFVPYYQPVIDIGTGRLVGCEALIRWIKPNGTVVEPDSFILLAESSGLAVPMTQSLMRMVRADLEHAFAARPQLKISINLFNDHFARLKTVSDIEEIFRGARISFSQLIFELTERQPLSNIQRARVIIRELQALGARVALDDAGAGHGGLAYLHHLGVDVVKIDRLFIETIGPDTPAAPIVDSLIRLGHDLGMEVIAEGVETFEQLDYLRRHGADSAQGYLFSPPLSARMFLDLVESMEPVERDQPPRAAMLPAAPPAKRGAVPAA